MKEAAEFGTVRAQQHPTVAVILNVLGATFAAMGQRAQAEQAYGRAIKLEPKNAEIHANLARYYQGVQAHDQAIQSFQTALKYAPNNATLHYNIGLSYQILGQIGPAIRSYQETVSMNAHLPEAWNNLGVVLNEQGKYAEAAETFKRAYALDNGASDAIRDNLRKAMEKLDDPGYTEDNAPEYSLVRGGRDSYLIRRAM